jgi:SOS response regulatory protein OraA/RecX
VEEIYHHALKLLRQKDYTTRQLQEKLKARFGLVPEEITTQLLAKRFLDDRRYAENFVARHQDSHPSWIRTALEDAGIDGSTAETVIAGRTWPSLRDVLKAKMQDCRLRPPLQRREMARLFRLLNRLGYPEEDIREELEQLHEQ